MALKIRLRSQGRKNAIVYRLVLSDSRSPRDGKCIETLGWYNPHLNKDVENVHVNKERVQYWIGQGAEISETAQHLVKRGAPEIIQGLKKQQVEKRAKVCAKKRSSRKKASA